MSNLPRPSPGRSEAASAAAPGRPPATSRAHVAHVALELFAARGYEKTTLDDVAAAVGVSRRTLFRYYASKNALPWGDFDAHLDHMRELLNDLDPDVPIGQALRTALLAFNSFDAQETARHRQRMRVILETAAQYSLEQGLTPRLMKLEEIFAKSAMDQ